MADYDVVIVGSGFGGAIPALRLAQDGRKVLCLEWGKKNTPKDFKQTYDPRYLLQLYVTRNNADFTYFVRYARTLGGGSMMFSGAMYRSPSEVFDYVDRSGYKIWPDEINRQVLDPYYDTVDDMLRINQVRWDEVPRAGGTFAKMIDKMGKTCDRGRYNYVDCKQCGFCEAGCIYDRKVTLLRTYIPQAEALGAEFRTECFATNIKPLPGGDGYEVFYRDAWEREHSIKAPMVLMAGGAVETAALLLRSGDDMPNLSDQVGKNFNNNGDIAFVWVLPEDHEFAPFHLYMGRDNSGMMCYAYWKDHRITLHPGGPPPGVIAGLDLHRKGELAWGLEHKRAMKRYYDGRMVIALAIGMVDGVGRIKLDNKGEAVIEFPSSTDVADRDTNDAYINDYITSVETNVAAPIAEANNAELLYTSHDGYEHGDAHCLAATRMAAGADMGVCDPYGEVFGYPNLFVPDSGGIPGGTGVNPAMTIAANAERIADYIVKNKR